MAIIGEASGWRITRSSAWDSLVRVAALTHLGEAVPDAIGQARPVAKSNRPRRGDAQS